MKKPDEAKTKKKRDFVEPKLIKHDSLTNATLWGGEGVSGASVTIK